MINKEWDNVKSRIEFLKQRKSTIEKGLSQLESDILRDNNAIQFLFEFSEFTRSLIKSKIESITNLALKATFPDKEIIFKIVPNKNKKGLFYKPYVETNGCITPLDDCKGGGVLDIVSVCLRISYLRLFKGVLEQTLILDEPFKNLDKMRLELAINWLSSISTEMGIQLIIITHIQSLINSSNKSFLFELKSGDITHAKETGNKETEG